MRGNASNVTEIRDPNIPASVILLISIIILFEPGIILREGGSQREIYCFIFHEKIKKERKRLRITDLGSDDLKERAINHNWLFYSTGAVVATTLSSIILHSFSLSLTYKVSLFVHFNSTASPLADFLLFDIQ